jgi:NADP-dependent 3-hydroxy acid dehydrogenase YdfG
MHSLKTVFITGAGSGIGATAARMYAKNGWFVGLYDLNVESVEALSTELGENSCFGFVNVTDRDAVDAAFSEFSEKTGGRLDVMLNNAGLFQDKPFVEADEKFIDLMMHVNMDGLVNCSRAAYPLLKQTPDSHLVNMGSASSIYGVPHNGIYSATKFFVHGLTEALRIEWEVDDITVNVVMPSYVATPMTQGVKLSHDKSGKLLTADQIAEAIWQASTTKGMYWILPFASRVQQFIVKLTPLALLPGLSKKLLKF